MNTTIRIRRRDVTGRLMEAVYTVETDDAELAFGGASCQRNDTQGHRQNPHRLPDGNGESGAMRYMSVCSGIEAATVAWHPLGWQAAAYSEIEAFPRAVLKHHYPDVPLHGDFTTIGANDYGAVDLIAGGTPCQAFSVAGLRKGFADMRGNLTLEFLRLADRKRPRWLVWENVPGVLSIDGGRAFGAFLGGLAELGMGFAYRVLDAEYFGVPQRRRRVFVVGCAGDWRRAAAVLFERESLQGDTPPCREAGKDVAPTLDSRAGRSGQHSFATSGELVAATAPTLPSRSTAGGGMGTDFDCDGGRIASTGNISHCLNAGAMGRLDYETETLIAHTLRGTDHDAIASTTAALGFRHSASIADGNPGMEECTPTLRRGDESGQAVCTSGLVRRLTPRECERLQGFPDDYTLVPYRGKTAADGPRYKAIGNSMAVPVMHWIGRRIQMVENLTTESEVQQ